VRAAKTGDAKAHRRIAREIAERYGRDAVDPLLDIALREQPGPANRFVLEALTEIAAPGDSALRAEFNRRMVDPWGAALVAAAWPEDERSRATLLRLSRPQRPEIWLQTIVYATGLLRSQDPTEVRKDLEAFADASPRPAREAVRALLASADYARDLPTDEDRVAYVDFERRLWRGYCVANKESRKAGDEFDAAAHAVGTNFKPGDERFVLRIFQATHVTTEEVQSAVALAGTGRIDRIRHELAAIAKSDHPNAAAARRAVNVIERRARPSDYPGN
jgi:hypothetical protein